MAKTSLYSVGIIIYVGIIPTSVEIVFTWSM